MKRGVIIALFIIFLVGGVFAAQGNGNNSQNNQSNQNGNNNSTCVEKGGEWKTFNSGCVDSCELAKQDPNNPIICTAAMTDGCDCGTDKCWDGKKCTNNKQNEIECEDYRYGTCPEGCGKKCVPSACVENGTCTADCEGEGSCYSNESDDDDDNETDDKKICCEIYGLGSMMEKVYVHYQWMKENDCITPEAFVGGGKEIVNDSLCTNVSKDEDKEAIQERNRLRFEERTGQECADDCICTGVVMKCPLEGGGREMTVYAGKSGNIIVQVKGVNMSTNVTLYHHNNSMYGIFKGNKTKEIKVFPDQAQEKIQERIRARIEKYGNITLNEDGYYEMQLQKRTRLFFLFPVREKVRAEVEAETGNVQLRNPWWGFLAKDVKE